MVSFGKPLWASNVSKNSKFSENIFKFYCSFRKRQDLRRTPLLRAWLTNEAIFLDKSERKRKIFQKSQFWTKLLFFNSVYMDAKHVFERRINVKFKVKLNTKTETLNFKYKDANRSNQCKNTLKYRYLTLQVNKNVKCKCKIIV